MAPGIGNEVAWTKFLYHLGSSKKGGREAKGHPLPTLQWTRAVPALLELRTLLWA